MAAVDRCRICLKSLGFIGTSEDDGIDGNDQDNIIDGLTGDDQLDGGGGNDTYIYRAGDGNDFISEGSFDGQFYGANSPFDKIQFVDLASSDVMFSRQEGDGTTLLVSITSTGEQITINGHLAAVNAGIELFEFTDKTITAQEVLELLGNDDVEGSEFDDYLVGGFTNDNFDPGEGDDYIETGGGNDVIHIGANSGNDTVSGYSQGLLGTKIRS